MNTFYVQRTNEVPSKPFTVFARHGNGRDDAEYIGDFATRDEATQFVIVTLQWKEIA